MATHYTSQKRKNRNGVCVIKSELEETLAYQIRVAGLPIPLREYKAIQGRQFRFDFAWPQEEYRLLVEIQGSIWKGVNGAHSSGTGLMRDHEKNNLAVLHGYRVLYANGNTITSGEALAMIERAIKTAPSE